MEKFPYIAAVLVIYAEDIDAQTTIQNISKVINNIVIIDNTKNGHPSLEKVQPQPGLLVKRNANHGGLAGAYNLAISTINSSIPEATHVLFLDEDTSTIELASFLKQPDTQQTLNDPSIAAIAPQYIEKTTKLPGNALILSKYKIKHLGRNLNNVSEVSFLINSMSLWSINALCDIGPYNEQLLVDHIDTDYCVRAVMKKYRLILNPSVKFEHSIGERSSYRFLNNKLQTTNHTAERRYLIGKNTILLAKHYFFRWPAFGFLCLIRLAYESLGIVLAEKNKWRKIKALSKGAFKGFITSYQIKPR